MEYFKVEAWYLEDGNHELFEWAQGLSYNRAKEMCARLNANEKVVKISMKKVNDNMSYEDQVFIEEEINRINPEAVNSELENMIQVDMKAFNIQQEACKDRDRKPNANLFAEHQGWLQEGFAGLEIVN